MKYFKKGKERNNMETELRKSGGNGETIVALRKEITSLERKLGIAAKEEELNKLKGKELKIRGDLERILQAGGDDEKLRKALKELGDEIWAEGKKLEALRDGKGKELKRLELELNQRRRNYCEKEASHVWSEIEALKKDLVARIRKLVSLGILWEANCPVRMDRFKSKLVLIRKRGILLPDGSCNPPGQARDADGFIVKQCELHCLDSFVKNGWEAVPGQNLELEPPNPGNSRPVKTLQAPPVISKIQNLQIEIDDCNVWTAPGQADAMVRAIEGEIDGGNERAS
jgi:hypothetical protein